MNKNNCYQINSIKNKYHISTLVLSSERKYSGSMETVDEKFILVKIRQFIECFDPYIFNIYSF